MNTIKKHAPLVWAAVVIIAAAAFVPLLAGDFRDERPPREIRLVVRDMAYFVDGAGPANPPLRAARGERLKLVLLNTDAGMSHDFSIPALQIQTRQLTGKGEEAIEFVAPSAAGVHEYHCTPHALMMRGTITVE